jgi:hypothetical protein
MKKATDKDASESSSVLSVVPSDKDLCLSDHCDDDDDDKDLPVDEAKEELTQLVFKENQAVSRWRKTAVALLTITATFVIAATFTTVRHDDNQTFATAVRLRKSSFWESRHCTFH